MTHVLNLTPHAVTVLNAKDEVVATFPASGESARLAVAFDQTDRLGDVPLGALRYGSSTGLPPRVDGVRLLVSLLVKLANPDRDDLLVVADEVRDEAGRIVGCRALASAVAMGDG
jgi:hypothetical protein